MFEVLTVTWLPQDGAQFHTIAWGLGDSVSWGMENMRIKDKEANSDFYILNQRSLLKF